MLLELASEYAHKGQTLSAVDNYKKCSDIIKNIYGE